MIKIREIEEKDFIPLSEFLPNGFPLTSKEFWLPIFELWWSLNPVFTRQIPRGWVLEKDGSILGFIGNIPVKYLVHGAERIAAASNSWYVDPSVRGIMSLIIFNEFLKQKSTSLFLFKGEDNKNIMNILSKYKFQEHILPQSQKEYVYIINKKNVYAVILKFLFTRKVPKVSEVWELYKRVGLLIIAYLNQKPVLQTGIFPEEAYISSLCTSCDETFSRLWEPYQNGCDVSLSRDIQTLNWLYFSSARYYERLVIQCHRLRDKTLAGYMVFDLIRNKTSDAGSMQLLDMCIENNDPQVLASLTSFAIETGKLNHAALLILWANSPEIETYFRSTIIMKRTIQHYRYVRFSETPEMKSYGHTYGNICLSMIYPPQ